MQTHTYKFLPNDLDEIYNRFNVAEDDRVSYTDYDIKCPCCGWQSVALYVLASSREEAERLLAEGHAGICGDCYADMLADRAPD